MHVLKVSFDKISISYDTIADTIGLDNMHTYTWPEARFLHKSPSPPDYPLITFLIVIE